MLQEQQGTAHSLEQHLTNQIIALQHQLAKQHTGQETIAYSHQHTVAALQTANQQLQQQCGRLEQDLQAALAYRHKCIQQKEELQQLRKQTLADQLRSEQDQGSAGDNADDQQTHVSAEISHQGADATHSPAGKLKKLATLVRCTATLLTFCCMHNAVPICINNRTIIRVCIKVIDICSILAISCIRTSRCSDNLPGDKCSHYKEHILYTDRLK